MRLLVTGGSGFIGTHLIARIVAEHSHAEILNIDLAEPKPPEHRVFWDKADILDRASLLERVKRFRPTHVVPMAARTDPDGVTMEAWLPRILRFTVAARRKLACPTADEPLAGPLVAGGIEQMLDCHCQRQSEHDRMNVFILSVFIPIPSDCILQNEQQGAELLSLKRGDSWAPSERHS